MTAFFQLLRYSLFIIMTVVVSAYAENTTNTTSNHLLVTRIDFIEYRGQQVEKLRFLISKHYLRIDAGKNSHDDFILLNRDKKVIYSVTPDREHIYSIALPLKRVTVVPPIPINMVISKLALPNAPTIMQQVVTAHTLKVNNKVCQKVSHVKVLNEVLDALILYTTILAQRQQADIDSIPIDLLEPCDLAISTFHATWYYRYGFPAMIEQKDYQRFLHNYQENYAIERSLFTLPDKTVIH